MPSRYRVGLNYRHIQESPFGPPEVPLIFLKPSSSIIGPLDHIILPESCKRVDYEGELGIVIGKKAKAVSKDQALDYVLGYTAVNDVSARDYQEKDKQWTRGKGIDTFCPFGRHSAGRPDNLNQKPG
jgi:2-keto-4-pentenoate hydratase/2-oxohepta-3-ene-1,7-dioic acid hydratase in catechol pathway